MAMVPDRFTTAFSSLRDDALSLRFHDGSKATVPFHLISRSATIQLIALLSNVSDECSISVPQGLLTSWLECVDNLPALLRGSETFTPNSATKMVQYLKVRDIVRVHLETFAFGFREVPV